MNKILTLVLLTTINIVSAQTIDRQVFTTAGNSVSNANHKITFTIGEPLIGTIQSSIIINQGFLAAASSSTTLAVDEQLLSTAIKVYPNPVTEKLSIDLNGVSGDAKVMIYSSTGQLLKTEKLNAQNNTINISHLQNGLYLVNLHFLDYKTVKTFKIIKK
jgi:hypothetical protein